MYLNQFLDFLKNSKHPDHVPHTNFLFGPALSVCNVHTEASTEHLRSSIRDALDEIIKTGDLLVLAEHIRPHSGLYGNSNLTYNCNSKNGSSPFVKNIRQLAGGSIHRTFNSDAVGRGHTQTLSPATIHAAVTLLASHAVDSALHQLKHRDRDTVCFRYGGVGTIIDARGRFLDKPVIYREVGSDNVDSLAMLGKKFQTEFLEDIIRLDDIFLTCYATALVKNAPNAV